MATIHPLFREAAFDAKVTYAMGEAFDCACRALHDVGQPDIVKEVIAKRIIELATSRRKIRRRFRLARIGLLAENCKVERN